MSIFELINKVLRSWFGCVKKYQGQRYNSSTIEHIASGAFFGLVISDLGFLNVWILLAFPLAWGYYAFFKELYLDRFKNKVHIQGNVWAQIIERSTGFVCSKLLTSLEIVACLNKLVNCFGLKVKAA